MFSLFVRLQGFCSIQGSLSRGSAISGRGVITSQGYVIDFLEYFAFLNYQENIPVSIHPFMGFRGVRMKSPSSRHIRWFVMLRRRIAQEKYS